MKLPEAYTFEECAPYFWRRVDVSTKSRCWPWLAGQTAAGYGTLSLRRGGKRTVATANRVALALHLKKDLYSLGFACHQCDNPICCNPYHLYEGNAATNGADMKQRNRRKGPQGETHHFALVTENEVKEIRAKYKYRTYGCDRLALEHNLDKMVIYRIVTRKTWNHVN